MAENENNADVTPEETAAAPTPEPEAPVEYVEIPDRSSANAARALQAARNLGVDEQDIRTTSKAFIVTAEVGDEYDRLLAEEVAATTEVTDTGERGEAGDGSEAGSEGGEQAGDGEQTDEVVEPKRSGSKADWVTFAKTKGYDESEDLSRDDLVARFGTPAE